MKILKSKYKDLGGGSGTVQKVTLPHSVILFTLLKNLINVSESTPWISNIADLLKITTSTLIVKYDGMKAPDGY